MTQVRSSPWLVSARFDLLWFVLPALVSLGLGALAGRLAGQSGDTPTWAWLVFVVLIDVAHVHGTTLRVYLDAKERARRPALYIGVPVAAWLVGAGLYSLSAAYFWRALAYLAAFHFIKQQVGWGRLYRKRNCERSRSIGG